MFERDDRRVRNQPDLVMNPVSAVLRAVWPWASYLAFVSLSFLTCNVGIVTPRLLGCKDYAYMCLVYGSYSLSGRYCLFFHEQSTFRQPRSFVKVF